MFGTTLEWLVDFLTQQSLQIVILFMCVLVLTYSLRKMSAHLRYLLWMLVILKCVTPSMVFISLPVLAQADVGDNSELPTDQGSGLASSDSGVLLRSLSLEPPSDPRLEGEETASNAVAPRTFDLATGSQAEMNLRWLTPANVLLVAWALVVIALSIRLLFQAFTLSRRLGRSQTATTAETLQVVGQLEKELGIRPVQVQSSSEVGQPFVWGWIRGKLILPKDFQNIGSPPQRRAILAHELAHISRWDATANSIQNFVQILFFFHPLVWWANRRLREERELCCDEFVVAGAHSLRATYCEAIVEALAFDSKRGKKITPSLAMAGSASKLEKRLMTILSNKQNAQERATGRMWAFAFAIACLSMPFSLSLVTQVLQADDRPQQAESGAKAPSDVLSESDGEMLFQAVDADTREPLEGVTLELQYQAASIGFNDVKTQTTEADGKTLIQLPKNILTMRIYPTKPGYVPLRVYWESDPKPELPETITIAMHRGSKIGGVLQNEAGEPIAGAKVWTHYYGTGQGASNGDNPHVRVNICDSNFQCKGVTETDAAGRWELDVLPADIEEEKFHLYFSHSEYVSDRNVRGISRSLSEYSISELQAQTQVTTLTYGETVQGTVVDAAGRPIGGAEIFFDEHDYRTTDKPIAITDEQGLFEIGGLSADLKRAPRREMWLTAKADGFATTRMEFFMGEKNLKVGMDRGYTISGRVIDWDGNPVAGAYIEANKRQLRLKTKTDGRGQFVLKNVPGGGTTYNIGKKGYMLLEHYELSAGTRAIEEPFEIELTKPLRIHGRIVDSETGERIENFKMIGALDYEDGRAPAWLEWYGDKQFEGERYEFGFRQSTNKYRLRVDAPGYMPMETPILDPTDPDKRDIPFDFELKKTDEVVRGQVLGLDGKPLAGATVYMARQGMNLLNREVTNTEEFDRNFVTTDAEGVFEFPPEVEPFCIVVVHPSGLGMTTEKEIAAGEPILLEAWNDTNHQQQIIRRPAPGVWVSFPK